MIIQFNIRSGKTFTVQIKEDKGHSFKVLVIKGGGKRFVGKIMVIAKNDMLNVKKIEHYKPKPTPQEKNRKRIAKLQKRLDERILSGEYRPKKISGFKNKLFTERVVAVKVDTTKIIRKVKVETTETIRFVKKG